MSHDGRQWNHQNTIGMRGPARFSQMPPRGRGGGKSSMHPPVPQNPQMGPPLHANFQHFSNSLEASHAGGRSDFGMPPPPQFSGFQNLPPPPGPFTNPVHGFAPPQNHSHTGQGPPYLHPQGAGDMGAAAPTVHMPPAMNFTTPPPVNFGTPPIIGQKQQLPGYAPFIPPPQFPTDHLQQSLGSFSNASRNVGNSDLKTEQESVRSEQDDKEIGAHQLKTWLQKVGKLKTSQSKAPPKTESHIQLWESIRQLKKMTQIMRKMLAHKEEMESSVSSVNSATWESMTQSMDAMKAEYTGLKTILEEPSVQKVEWKLNKTRQKRARLRRSRRNKFEEQQNQQQAWEEKSQQIDRWQKNIQTKIREENKRKSRKAAADRTLSKVTREIQDATRLIDTMLSLQKLRLIRRDAAQKRGDTDLGESRQAFEEKIADMTRLVQSQLECYKAEEAKLKQVIKSEQEESSRQERLVQAEKERQKQKEEDDELQSMLFGPQDEITEEDPVFPYAQYYRQAESNLEAFIQIRREWDSFLVPENTPASSAIPGSWIVPDEPSSAIWASALK